MNCTAMAPAGRKAVFLGDLCDRGPKNAKTPRLVMSMVQAGDAFCVAGNHDVKLLKKLKGSDVQLTHGLDRTIEQLQMQDDEFITRVKDFLDGLISHYVFDNGKLVVAHARCKEKYKGRGLGCVFGGKLSAYHYPEGETIQVKAKQEYYASAKSFLDKPINDDDILNIDDVLGQKYLTTRLRRSIKIEAENAGAALELRNTC